MATQVQLRRGTSTQNDSFTGAQGELTFDTTNKRVRIHDGATAGGFELKTENAGGDTLFADNEKAIFGAGSDLEISSNGASAIIRAGNASSDIRLESDNRIVICDRAFNETFAVFNDDDDVKLYHDNAPKLATTSTGIDVTGTVTADGLNVNASASGNFGAVISSATSFSSDALRLQRNGVAAQGMNITAGGESVVFDGQNTGSGGLHSIFEFKSTDETTTKNVAKFNGKTNDISFYEDTGTTAKFFWDASEENLGIGTSSPYVETDLHILNSATSTGLELSCGAASANAVRLFAYDRNTATNNDLIVRSSEFIVQTNGENERMRIDSSGRTGIGTSSPAYKLDVNGGLSSNGSENVMRIAAADSSQAGGINIHSIYGNNSNDRVTTLFSIDGQNQASPLAFGTGSTEAMRIDSSGNLLVGKTTTSLATAGITLGESGFGSFTRSGFEPLNVNRLSSDGNLAVFYKDGGTVGSIGIQSTGFYIDGESGHAGVRFSGSALIPRDNGSDSNGVNNLGSDINRFKDAYLSGGVYLGGTGSANKLDDYEEGTWTPLITGSGNSIASGTAVGRYVKVGETVFVWMTLNNNASNTYGSSVITFSGLPFTSQPSSSGNPVPLTTPVFYRYVTPPSGANQLVTYVSGSYNHLEFYWTSQNNWDQFTGSHINNDASFALYVGAIYRTNA